MAHAKGQQPISTSLRVDEVLLVDDLVARLEDHRQWAQRTPERYQEHRPSDHKVTRAGVARAAVRYALEHEEQFRAWMRTEREVGIDDAK